MGKIRFPHLGFDVSMGNSFSIFGFEIAFYGIIIALGMIAGAFVAYRDAKRTGQRVDDYVDYTLFGIIGAIVGARLYYVAFEWDYYKENLSEIVNLRAGGLAIYGAIIGAVLVLLVYCRIKRKNMLQMLDTIVLGVVVGQIIGRWGNFFNREAYGGFTDCIFAMQIPVKDAAVVRPDLLVFVDGIAHVQVHPTFLYESFFNLILFVILMLFRHKQKFYGETFCRYLLGYGIIRFFIEGMRTDQLMIKNIPVSQALSFVLAVGSLGVMITMHILRRKSDWLVIVPASKTNKKSENTENTTSDEKTEDSGDN